MIVTIHITITINITITIRVSGKYVTYYAAIQYNRIL